MVSDGLKFALRKLAEGQVSVTDAETALRTHADVSFGTNPAWVEWREPLPADVSIRLDIGDVRRALERFLAGTWPARELHLWAQIIVLVGAYDLPPPPAEDEDYYDAVWDVLHELSSPEIHGIATATSVRGQLAQLASYRAQDSG